MPFSEFELHKIRRQLDDYVEKKRPPMPVRKQLDFRYRIENQSFFIYEVRPYWKDEGEEIEHGVIKATWVKSHKHWRIYWLRKDLRWHRYEPFPTARSVAAVLQVADRDECGCFYG